MMRQSRTAEGGVAGLPSPSRNKRGCIRGWRIVGKAYCGDQNPIMIPSRSFSARLLLRRACHTQAMRAFFLANALRLARAQRKDAMGDRRSRNIRSSAFLNPGRLAACKFCSAT